jgi:hypothetical protein
MGMSGSYGGSGKRSWQQARQTTNNAFGGGGGGEDGSPPLPPPPDTDPGHRQDLLDILHTIADGLRSDDPALRRPRSVPRVPLSQVLAGGAALGGLPFIGSPRRQRGRPVMLGARQTGAALGGALAIRSQDATALAELGLNLDDLRELGPLDQTRRLVDRVFGASADEDDQAFREAASRILLALLELPADVEPDYHRIICDAVAEVIYQRALVEITDQLRTGSMSRADAAERERQIHDFIRDLVRADPTMRPAGGSPTPEECSQVMAELTARAIEVLRAGGDSRE